MKRKLSLFSEQHFWNRIYQNPMVHLLPPSLTLWLRRVSHLVTVKMGKVLLTTAYPLNPPTSAWSCLIFQSFLKEQLGKSRAILSLIPQKRNWPSPGAKAHHCLTLQLTDTEKSDIFQNFAVLPPLEAHSSFISSILQPLDTCKHEITKKRERIIFCQIMGQILF